MSAARQHRQCSGALLCRACAASYLGVSTDTLDATIRQRLPCVRVGGRVLFARADLESERQAVAISGRRCLIFHGLTFASHQSICASVQLKARFLVTGCVSMARWTNRRAE